MSTLEFNFKSGEYRTCTVGGVKAIFHRWAEKEDMFIKTMGCYRKQDLLEKLRKSIETCRVLTGGESIEKIRNTVAIVEFADGHIEEVNPVDVKFQDTYDIICEDARFSDFFNSDDKEVSND